jgi:hypothetical protein
VPSYCLVAGPVTKPGEVWTLRARALTSGIACLIVDWKTACPWAWLNPLAWLKRLKAGEPSPSRFILHPSFRQVADANQSNRNLVYSRGFIGWVGVSNQFTGVHGHGLNSIAPGAVLLDRRAIGWSRSTEGIHQELQNTGDKFGNSATACLKNSGPRALNE